MEAVVSNTRLRMERGVGVAGNGMGLLNGQTTKQDFIDLVEWLWDGVVYKARLRNMGLHHQVYLGHVPKDFREPIRGIHDLLRQKTPSLLIL
jgi:hypothetical protein